jgi:DedD protein
MFDRVVGVGLRPYQETVKTDQGDWIRVRVGPFTTRQDAERAQQDLKRAGVTAAIIAL